MDNTRIRKSKNINHCEYKIKMNSIKNYVK